MGVLGSVSLFPTPALLGTALPQQLLAGIPPGLCGTRLFWLCLSFENTLAKVLKDAGPAPDSAIELPDKAVLLTEPLFATA